MDKPRAPLVLALIVTLLAGCTDQPPSKRTDGATERGRAVAPGGTPSATEPPSPPPASASPTAGTGGSGVDDDYPDLSPPKLTPDAEKGEKGARNVLLSWARAIELEEFDQAWSMLSQADRTRWSRVEWRRMFADLKKITVAMPRGEMEGAAGSLYYTAPLTITASDSAGRPVQIEGEALLRRVNDVDGAAPAQLRWHFERVTLDWTH